MTIVMHDYYFDTVMTDYHENLFMTYEDERCSYHSDKSFKYLLRSDTTGFFEVI